MHKKTKVPWPTVKVMEQIYNLHLWGGDDSDYYSGSGSHDEAIVEPYLKALIHFFELHNKALRVCDLGCGDFNIGQRLIPFIKSYVGIDIVPDLINRNKNKFESENVKFLCLDISKDHLPVADCVIIRQVFQHLSNHEIQQILNQLKPYKFLILTEHIPNQAFIPNKDKIASQGIRLKQNSGVDILFKPFKFQITSKALLNEVILTSGKGKISTWLYTLS